MRKIVIIYKVTAEQIEGNMEEFIKRKVTPIMKTHPYAEVEIRIEVNY